MLRMTLDASRWLVPVLSLPLLAVLPGCSDAGGEADTNDWISGTSEGGTLDGGTTSGDGSGGSTSGDAGDTGGNDGGNPDGGVYAEGIAIDQIEFNQGVGITVASGGQVADPNSFSAPVIGGRSALVRVGWTTDAGFSPRSIVARLTLVHADQTFHQFEQTLTVSSNSDMRRYDGAFAIEVPAEQLRGGDRFVVGLFEADESLPGASTPPRVPATGDADLGAWGDPMRARVVVIPANDPAIDGSTYQLTDAMKQMLEADLYNLYPVQEIEVVYHDPVTITGCNDGANILAQVSSYRNSEGYGGDVYYHAIFRDTHNNNCWAGGMAWLVGEGQNEDRVSYSINHPGESPNNWTHELGHSHGRPHSFEDTSSYQPNAYPGPDCGHRSTNGYALIPYQHPKYVEWNYGPMANMDDWIVAPTEGLPLNGYCEGHADFDAWGPAMQDVMSYAYPYWVSAYTYRSLAQRVRTTSAWGDVVEPPVGKSLHVLELQDGSLMSYEMDGAPTFTVADDQFVTLELADGSSLNAPARAKVDGEGVQRGWVLALPQSASAAPVQLEVAGQVRSLKPVTTPMR